MCGLILSLGNGRITNPRFVKPTPKGSFGTNIDNAGISYADISNIEISRDYFLLSIWFIASLLIFCLI